MFPPLGCHALTGRSSNTCPTSWAKPHEGGPAPAPSLASSQLPGWLDLIFNEMFPHVTVQELACWWTLDFLLLLLKFQTSMNGSWILWNIFWKLLSYRFLFLFGFVEIERYNGRILEAETALCIWGKSYLAAHCAIFFGILHWWFLSANISAGTFVHLRIYITGLEFLSLNLFKLWYWGYARFIKLS